MIKVESAEKTTKRSAISSKLKAHRMKIIFGRERSYVEVERPAIRNDCSLPSAARFSGHFVCFDG